MITPAYSPTATERVLPKLALDFTTAVLDPRITFTRATSSSNPATYVGSNGFISSAANNQPRFDYDPATLACNGLLIEESRANLLLHSQTFTNGVWSQVSAGSATAPVVTANYAISPDGTQNAARLQCETSGATSSDLSIIQQNVSVSATGTNYTNSIYVKSNTGSSQTIYFRVNGADSTTTATLTNEWTRISLTATLASNVYLTIGSRGSANGAASVDISIWAGQIEAGAFATSYIPTTSAALTRNADVATMTGTNFSDWYSAGAGGVVARALPSTVSGTRPVLQFDDATADEVITLRGSTTNPELVIVDGGAPQAQIDAGTIAANTAYNLGAAWNTDNCAAAVNGGAAVTDTTATIPTVTQARLGSDGTNYLNGHLQTVRYWPQRIINAEVQAFSK